MILRRLTALALVTLVAAACARGEAEWAGSVTDSAGIAIVANPSQGMWGPGDEWTMTEELRIGALEGDPDYQFGQVGWIAVASDGRIYVLDMQAQQLRVYGADGSFEQTIASRGGGPGELQGAMFVLMGLGDTLLVPDNQNQRVNRYGPDGASLGSHRIAFEEGIPMMYRATGSGVIAKQVREMAFPGQPAIENPQDVILRVATDGTVMDTLLSFPSGESFKLSGSGPEFKIYSAEAVWDLSEGGELLFAINNDYRIRMYSSAGELDRIISKPFELTPVSQRDKDAIVNFMERLWKDLGVPAATVEQLRSAIKFGDNFPAFATVVAGPGGTIWVQHIQPASELTEEEYAAFNPMEDTGAPEWDVFDAQGRYLGVVTMPARFTPRVIRGDKVYGVWRDELDVQYVVRMRIAGYEET